MNGLQIQRTTTTTESKSTVVTLGISDEVALAALTRSPPTTSLHRAFAIGSIVLIIAMIISIALLAPYLASRVKLAFERKIELAITLNELRR